MPVLDGNTQVEPAARMASHPNVLERHGPGCDLRLVTLPELSENSPLRDAWNQLAFSVPQPEIFYTYEWALAVQKAYSSSIRPLILLGYRGESLVGIAPLATDVNHQHATFLCGTTADYCDFLTHPGLGPVFTDRVFAQLKNLQIRSLVLSNLPANSPSVEAITRACSRHHFHLFSRPAYACARVVLGSPQERADIKKNVEHKKMLQRNLNGLKRQGPISLNHLRTWTELRNELPQFAKVHVARFLSTGRFSNQICPERRRFLEELARLLSEKGWLKLTRLMAGTSPVAWNYGFQFAGSWFWYQPTLDTKFEKYSPGFCLLSKIIEEACDAPDLNLVDLGLGAEEYKARFSTAMRHTLHLTATQSFPQHLKELGRYRAAQFVKVSPQLEAAIRSGLRKFATARRRLRGSHLSESAGLISRRFWQSSFGCDKVMLYEWAASPLKATAALHLRPLDLDLLAEAAMQYADDPRTLEYLLRCATRLRSDVCLGFAVLTKAGIPVHFAWAAPFEGFQMAELRLKLTAPSPESFLIFDCWTPLLKRGQGFYKAAIYLVARRLLQEGKSPWIFSAASNTPSVRGIESAGFQRRFCLVRRKLAIWSRVQRRELSGISPSATEVSLSA